MLHEVSRLHGGRFDNLIINWGVYIKSPLIAQFVHGDSLENYSVVIIFPESDFVAMWAKDKDLKASYEKLCASDSPTGAELKANVSREMDRLVTEYKLSALSASRSSRALGEVHARAIPTFKLKRSFIV
ncbi:hypothetical protein PF002_g19802 [Phytophthora fragariae]|uniref:Uncharacterized protein n=2 Tax=Phytophthora fragariae TaxID=53985 RepID=A0A6A3XRV8_9STRA|nr:hypothetical protein PF002_g19802 [Phytophthora fragariae]